MWSKGLKILRSPMIPAHAAGVYKHVGREERWVEKKCSVYDMKSCRSPQQHNKGITPRPWIILVMHTITMQQSILPYFFLSFLPCCNIKYSEIKGICDTVHCCLKSCGTTRCLCALEFIKIAATSLCSPHSTIHLSQERTVLWKVGEDGNSINWLFHDQPPQSRQKTLLV